MKNTPTTARLTTKAGQALLILQKDNPDASLAKILEDALCEALHQRTAPRFAAREVSSTETIYKYIKRFETNYTTGIWKDSPNAAANALAAQTAADLVEKVLHFVRQRPAAQP